MAAGWDFELKGPSHGLGSLSSSVREKVLRCPQILHASPKVERGAQLAAFSFNRSELADGRRDVVDGDGERVVTRVEWAVVDVLRTRCKVLRASC